MLECMYIKTQKDRETATILCNANLSLLFPTSFVISYKNPTFTFACLMANEKIRNFSTSNPSVSAEGHYFYIKIFLAEKQDF